jgi:hypothetical protein
MSYRTMALVAASIMTLSGSALAQKIEPTPDSKNPNFHQPGGAGVTTVKGSKSNSSDRMGGGGGGKGAVQHDNGPPRGGGRDVGSRGHKGATCCSSLIPNAAGTDCVCR